jgi:hypothetical protein
MILGSGVPFLRSDGVVESSPCSRSTVGEEESSISELVGIDDIPFSGRFFPM